jgi:hypothetical protein
LSSRFKDLTREKSKRETRAGKNSTIKVLARGRRRKKKVIVYYLPYLQDIKALLVLYESDLQPMPLPKVF